MMHQPWDCAQPDEWLPQSLRLCWGSDGGDGGGGGFSGDSGGWGSDSGGANTGGGDWGSSGSYDASGFNAGGDIGAWAGSAYDASTAGTGMGGGGDWGSFGDTSYGSFNAPNPIFTDVAGPNPGVLTGGGDWGSAGMFSAEGTGGGPNGAMVGATQGAGSGFWGGDTGGGGPFGDYGGGGGGGATYGGGGQQGGNQSAFGGFTTPSNTTSTVGSASFGQVGSVSARSDAPTRSEAEVASVAAPTRSEAEISSVSPEAQAAPDADPDAQSDFGKPAEPDAAPEAAPVAAPEVSSTIAASRETNFDYGPSAAPEAAPAAPSHFGPQSINADYEGSPYASNYDQGAPSQSYQQAAQQLSDLTQSALQPDYTGPFAGPDVVGDRSSAYDGPFAGPDVVGGARSDPAFADRGNWGDLAGIYSTGISNVLANMFPSSLDLSVLANPNTWLSPQNQAPIVFPSLDSRSWVDAQSPMGMPGHQAYAGPFAGPDVVGDRSGGANLADQLGLQDVSSTQSINPGGEQYGVTQDLASQLGIGDIPASEPWGSVFEGAPGNIDWGSVFEGAAPAEPDWGSVFEGASPDEAIAPAIEAFIPGSRETNFEYADQAPAIEAFIPAGRETDFNYNVEQPPAIDIEIVSSTDPSVPADPRAQPTTTLPPAVETAETRPAQQQEARPAEQQQEARPAEQQQQAPPQVPPQAPPQQPQVPPSLIEQAQTPPQQAQPIAQPTPSAPLSFQGTPPTQPAQPPAPTPQQPPQAQPAPNEHEDEADPRANTPVEPGRPLGAPTTRTQNTPVNTPRVRQEQQGAIRNRPVNEALHGILTGAAERANVIVRVGSGGQPPTGPNRTGTHRHDDGGAADVRLEQNGRLLNYNNPQDRGIMETFVREAARLGATGMGAGMRYMGPNTIHVGFGNPSFWRADNPGSRALQQAYNEGRQGPANRPPANIPVRTAQPAAQPAPPGGWRGIGGDIGREARLPQQPEVTQPAALPPVALPDPVPAPVAPVDRPLADIPPPAPVTPAPFLTPPVRGRVDPVLQTRFANDLLKDATKNLNKDSGQDAFQAASVVAAKALAAAGIPLALARDLMTKGALDGAIKNGYGPGGPNSTVMGFSIWGKVQSAIADGVNAALQGYKPAAPGPVQGPYGFQPDAPAVPGKQGALPSGQQYAGLSQSTGPAPENYGRGTPALQHLSPIINPQQPTIQNDWGKPPAIEPPPPPLYKPGDPGMFNPFRGNEAELQPEAPSSLLSFLSNFNPISTAEARSTGRSQASQLQAPRADSGTIQGRLAEARSNIINELQTNQGLRNTLDLIATGEVGSQGKAAVLGWLETAMNKAAAEASQQGRAPTGRDLLNYLNNRSYFPDTWGKIESGKIKGGALTDDLLSEVGAGSNTTKGSTGNSSSKSEGSRFGGNPTNVTIGREHYGVENYAHHAAWYNALGAPEAGRGIGSDFAAQPDMSAVVAVPPVSAPDMSLRGLAKGGHVDKDEPVVVGEEGPEYFVPDQSGTVVPHMPQKGGGDDFGRWPKLPTPDYPGRYAGVGREMKRQMREAQNPIPTLIDLVDSGQLRLTPNWHRMLNDPSLIALGQSRMGTVDAPAPEPAAEPPDPTSPMAQALGYGSIRRPMRIGRQSY